MFGNDSPGLHIEFNALHEAIAPLLRPFLEQVGTEEVANIRQALSVLVEFTAGGIIRSRPGEPPRKELGALQAGVTHIVVTEQSGLPVLYILSSRQHDNDSTLIPTFLEYGTARMWARPYMRPALTRLEHRLSSGGFGAQASAAFV